jgi:hypothetical protein
VDAMVVVRVAPDALEFASQGERPSRIIGSNRGALRDLTRP